MEGYPRQRDKFQDFCNTTLVNQGSEIVNGRSLASRNEAFSALRALSAGVESLLGESTAQRAILATPDWSERLGRKEAIDRVALAEDSAVKVLASATAAIVIALPRWPS